MTNHFASLNFLFAHFAIQSYKYAVIFPMGFKINLLKAIYWTPVHGTFEVNLRTLSVVGDALAELECLRAAGAVELNFL